MFLLVKVGRLVDWQVTLGVGDSLQAPLEVGDDQGLHRVPATLGSVEHSLFLSFQLAGVVLQHFSRKNY